MKWHVKKGCLGIRSPRISPSISPISLCIYLQ